MSRESHDHNFKNLILDYPREAIAFFASAEARAIDADVRILPIREEQANEVVFGLGRGKRRGRGCFLGHRLIR